jgi:elongation of very long chain fatty acids protein 6
MAASAVATATAFVEAQVEAALPKFTTHAVFEQVNANGYAAPGMAVVGYLALVFAIIPAIRPAKCGPVWRHLFAMWNLLLSAFSWVGVLVCVPFVYRGFAQHGVRWMLCSDEMMWGGAGSASAGPVGVMMSAFMLSKFPELLDTFFLVYMRKSVPFLHWYHHASVLLYCWFAYKNATPSAVTFATMNYCVHAVMYLYFAVSTYTRALSFMRLPITTMQLSQMVLGVALTGITYTYAQDVAGGGCSPTYADSGFFPFCSVLYGSYLVLFAKLFADNYIFTKKKMPPKGAAAAGKPKRQ